MVFVDKQPRACSTKNIHLDIWSYKSAKPVVPWQTYFRSTKKKRDVLIRFIYVSTPYSKQLDPTYK